MNEEEFLKANKCSKEELIEWLIEMYRDARMLKDIIHKYEEACRTTQKQGTEQIDDPVKMERKIIYYTDCQTTIYNMNIQYRKFGW